MGENIKYLNPEDIRYIHDYILEATAGLKGQLDSCLDSLCQSAEAYHDDQTLVGLAAYYLSKISKNHCFNDGNKRAGYFATRYFLMLNGADFNGTDAWQAAEEIEKIAGAGNNEAYSIAHELVQHYIVTDQMVIPDMHTFERIVLKSISVANILSRR